MVYFITYLLLVVATSLISLNKRVSFIEIFYISLLLTPIIGLITVLRSDKNILTHRYFGANKCKECGDAGFKDNTLCKECGFEIKSVFSKRYELDISG